MDKRMVEEKSEAEFHKSLKELRDLSSQLYQAADYCKTAFLTSKDKNHIVETTKEYVARAVVVAVDHLGTMSATLECCISETTSISQTECKIERLMQRIGTCQNYSYKISLHRFHCGAEFSRYHCRYVSLPLKDSTVSSYVSCYSRSCIDAENGEETSLAAAELLFLDSEIKKKNVVPALLNSTTKKTELQIMRSTTSFQLVPVEDDGLSTLPKIRNSVFQFQEANKIKRGSINWKVMVQSKDIAALIKRGRRLLA